MDINDFILTQVEIKEIQGKTFAFQYVNFKGTRLPIVGIVSPHNSGFIEYASKRPVQNTFPQSSLSYTTPIQDFFTDLGMIFYGLNEVEILDNNAILDAAAFICANHIQNAGRLIDTDLYSYIDLIIFAKNTIWSKLNNSPLSDEAAAKLWIEIKQHLFNQLKNFIFITKYNMSNPLQPQPYLEKYSN